MTAVSGVSAGSNPAYELAPAQQPAAPAATQAPAVSDPDHDGDHDGSGGVDVKV